MQYQQPLLVAGALREEQVAVRPKRFGRHQAPGCCQCPHVHAGTKGALVCPPKLRARRFHGLGAGFVPRRGTHGLWSGSGSYQCALLRSP